MTVDPSQQVRISLVGCGRIARRHAELLGGGHLPGVVLAGVCDVVPDRPGSSARSTASPGTRTCTR